MKLIGQINDRQIYYCNIRSAKEWYSDIHFKNWIAFTIVDEDDKELITDMAIHCLDNGVCYTCSAGELASISEDYFDGEIVMREVNKEMETGVEQDYESTPMTSYHKNFDEGFWFATTLARQSINDQYILSTDVVCIDCTKLGVSQYLKGLIKKINSGWLPDDTEYKKPEYDTY